MRERTHAVAEQRWWGLTAGGGPERGHFIRAGLLAPSLAEGGGETQLRGSSWKSENRRGTKPQKGKEGQLLLTYQGGKKRC